MTESEFRLLNDVFWLQMLPRGGNNEAIAQNGVLDLLMNIPNRSELRKCSMQFRVIVVFNCWISGWLYYSFPWLFKWHSLPMLLLLCLSSSVCGCVICMCDFVFLLICCRYFLFFIVVVVCVILSMDKLIDDQWRAASLRQLLVMLQRDR